MNTTQPVHQRHVNTTYELFIGALSLLAIVNIFLLYVARNEVVDGVLFVIELVLSLFFLGDFCVRLLIAPSRSRYFLREFGWADLLSSVPIPFIKILRIFRLVTVTRMMRQNGTGRLLGNLIARRAESTLLIVTWFLILIAEFGGIGVAFTEARSTGANITSGGDAIWYVFVTITTVGYGDRYPVTQEGRLMGMLIMLAGVGVFAVFTGYVANLFLRAPLRKADTSLSPQDPRRQLAEVRDELLQHEIAFSELRKKLNEIEKTL